jgi:hypothetical protein
MEFLDELHSMRFSECSQLVKLHRQLFVMENENNGSKTHVNDRLDSNGPG